MVKVTVLSGKTDELIGDFEFDQIPRKGDEITVPWAADREGIRIFEVTEVRHIAAGVYFPDVGRGAVAGPCTILRYCEEVT